MSFWRIIEFRSSTRIFVTFPTTIGFHVLINSGPKKLQDKVLLCASTHNNDDLSHVQLKVSISALKIMHVSLIRNGTGIT